MKKKIWGKRVLLPGGWSSNTLIDIDQNGKIKDIKKNVQPSNQVFDTLIPSPMNLHSHCFQRAMSGLSERSESKTNDFWSWRNFMYNFLNKITPDYFEAICAIAQMEMLEAGYSGVSEFHYLHNDLSGVCYNKISEMSERVINASKKTGIGLTLLPVLYEHNGINGGNLISGQDRFGLTFHEFEKLFEEIIKSKNRIKDFQVGVAAHSLRAVKKRSLLELSKNFTDYPIHIHVAEQKKEVLEVSNAWSKRPIEWLIDNLDLNSKWCLIHCTQMLNHEAKLLAKTGAVIGLCPVTEANLGDGIFNGKSWLKEGGKFGIGTDSNVKISLFEELRTLEYSQRLKYRKRIVLKQKNSLSIGRDLIETILDGGQLASGRKTGKIKAGFWADILALDLSSSHYSSLNNDEKLNYLIFSENEKIVDSVFSAGRWVVKKGKHIDRKKIIVKYFESLRKIAKSLN
jgi:formimidoylglutamate deiminase